MVARLKASYWIRLNLVLLTVLQLTELLKDTSWLTVLGEVAIGMNLVCVIIFLITPRQGQKEYIFLGLVFFATLLSDAYADTAYWVFKQSGNIAANIWTIVIPIFYFFLYRSKTEWARKNIVYVLVAVFVIFGVINFCFIQGPTTTNSYTSSIKGAILIIFSLTYFYTLLQQLPTQSITRLPMFWINSAVLIYYSGTFFVYLSADYLINVENDRMIFSWLIHHFLACTYYPMLGYAMLLVRAEYIKSANSATANG